MKEITLRFREVAIDGLPQESGEVVVLLGQDNGVGIDRFYDVMGVNYSAKHGAFNSYDHLPEHIGSLSDDVLYWCPASEVDAILKEVDA